jgi:hypothetical protein
MQARHIEISQDAGLRLFERSNKTVLNISEWHYRRLKGRIASHVARGSDNQKAIIKSAQTMLAKGELGLEELRRMLGEVENDSVQPFLQPPWNQPDRLSRFRLLESGLAS